MALPSQLSHAFQAAPKSITTKCSSNHPLRASGKRVREQVGRSSAITAKRAISARMANVPSAESYPDPLS